MIISIIEIIKRFIPDNVRTYANPALAIFTGLAGAYYIGGSSGIADLFMNGISAGIGAIGAYKIPKEIANKVGIE